ncbi:MAG: tRNA glutamyl-Q(34) synthetase GluQRS [Pseudohongiella nitratireducens]|nr:tRNA glutamyl-Q(34) synthetase GluQRS [Pseudohongiella nitratireducens]MDF1623787.1 tRNA glutamyl-Q(34) synthetase GluQRS [Pseudohongiella nitratireducens]
MSVDKTYTGRFAPSPSGPLHFGSLLAALASFLDARSRQGTWLVRMEDLDPAREPPGTADLILHTLEAFLLCWDGDVVYQSQRQAAYDEAIAALTEQRLCFHCACPRQRIRELKGVYDGHCRTMNLPDQGNALRLRVTDQCISFEDAIQGLYQQNLQQACGDFVIRRRDRLTAYQLAVVVDDAWQDITHVVRGVDLLDSTPRQIYLQSQLGFPLPYYAHIPVAVNRLGQKLSKQHFAPALPENQINRCLTEALIALGHPPPHEIANDTTDHILTWAIHHWDVQKVPKLDTIPVSSDLADLQQEG